MGVSDINQTRNGNSTDQTTEEAMMDLIHLLQSLPLSERSSCALGLASRLIEYSAFELAGRRSADDVAQLIDCAARMDLASSDRHRPTLAVCPDLTNRRLQ